VKTIQSNTDIGQEILVRLRAIECRLDSRSLPGFSSPTTNRRAVITPTTCNKCGRSGIWTQTLKGKNILLSEVEDEDDGQYILNDEGFAAYARDFGTHTFHANVCV
jgi:hypothetical protein